MESKAALSILIVEDDVIACELIGIVLEHQFPGSVIYTANSGIQGLELFKKYLPFLVISDVNMSELNGIQLAREIKSIKDDTRFIVLTGSSDQKQMEIFKELDVIDYIVKPVEFKRLFAAVQSAYE